MREGLGEVAVLAPAAWVVFLGQQTHVVPQGQQALEQLPRLITATGQDG
jgi:hypothetical protein